jgi:hypothetical protein
MAATLETPKEIIQKITTVQITSFENNNEGKYIQINYITLQEDGTPYQRGNIKIEGYNEVKAFYAEMDAILATGKNFEDSSAELLYSKIIL